MKSFEASLGKTHKYTLRFTSNYATFLHNTGRYVEALPLYEEAYTRTLDFLGTEHADTKKRKQQLDCLLEVIEENNSNTDQKKEAISEKDKLIGAV
jgi:hypothetical protein